MVGGFLLGRLQPGRSQPRANLRAFLGAPSQLDKALTLDAGWLAFGFFTQPRRVFCKVRIV